jgi:hypothetical protein
LLLQSIVVELRVFAFYLLPVPRMRFCLQTFFFSTGEDISECGGRGRESSQGYGYPRMCRTMIMTLWKLRPTEGLHVLLKVRSGTGDNDEGRFVHYSFCYLH